MVGFWVFMMIMNLLIPITMIGLGNCFSKNAPKEINMIFGYRTTRSMKNKETWEFAHHFCGKMWVVFGWILLISSSVAMFFVFGKSVNIVGTFGGIVCVIQLVVLIGSIFPTEVALEKKFDKNGYRRK